MAVKTLTLPRLESGGWHPAVTGWWSIYFGNIIGIAEVLNAKNN